LNVKRQEEYIRMLREELIYTAKKEKDALQDIEVLRKRNELNENRISSVAGQLKSVSMAEAGLLSARASHLPERSSLARDAPVKTLNLVNSEYGDFTGPNANGPDNSKLVSQLNQHINDLEESHKHETDRLAQIQEQTEFELSNEILNLKKEVEIMDIQISESTKEVCRLKSSLGYDQGNSGPRDTA
jgi:hypothetical protein